MKIKKSEDIYDLYLTVLRILLLISTYLLVMTYLPYIIKDIIGLLKWELSGAVESIINVALYLGLLKCVVRFCKWPVAKDTKQKFTAMQKETVFLIGIFAVSVAFVFLGAIAPWISNIPGLLWLREDAEKFVECGANGILLCIGFAVSLKELITSKGKVSVIGLFTKRLRQFHKLGFRRTCMVVTSFIVYVFVGGLFLSAIEGWLSQLIDKL